MVNKLLKDQYGKYPALQPKDIIKALYQSEFGCAHFDLGEDEGMRFLLNELNRLHDEQPAEVLAEDIGDRFCRVHLGAIAKAGLSPKTLFRLFSLSSRYYPGTIKGLTEKLERFTAMCDSGELPFNPSETKRLVADYKESGCPAVHHSSAFKAAYFPAYRVIRKDYCRLLPLLCRIDQTLYKKARAIVAIEGNCAAGKTTLAAFLAKVYPSNVFHMDDFFLRPHQRTEARLAEPGGNVDYERFYSEVMAKLIQGDRFSYRPYSCQTQALLDPVDTIPKPLNIIEGAYSLHPALTRSCDISVFMSVESAIQQARILKRNGEDMQKRFIQEWIPMENRYFEYFDIRAQCDFILNGAEVLTSI